MAHEMIREKVIVITGAAGGIGSAIAHLLSQEGAILVLTDIRRDKLEEVGKSLQGWGQKIFIFEHDVSNPDSWEKLIAQVKQDHKKIDGLINNAGVVDPAAAESATLEEIKHQISVNLMGTIYGCRAALKVMKEQGFGKIINIASLGGIIPMPGEAIYSATKSAIRQYSFCLRAELHNTPIGVTVICPDSVATPQLDHELLYDEAVLSFIGNPLKPENVAKAVFKAIIKNKPEIIVPTGLGVICRLAMAFPRVFFWLLPLLVRIGKKTMIKRREKQLTLREAKDALSINN